MQKKLSTRGPTSAASRRLRRRRRRRRLARGPPGRLALLQQRGGPAAAGLESLAAELAARAAAALRKGAVEELRAGLRGRPRRHPARAVGQPLVARDGPAAVAVHGLELGAQAGENPPREGLPPLELLLGQRAAAILVEQVEDLPYLAVRDAVLDAPGGRLVLRHDPVPLDAVEILEGRPGLAHGRLGDGVPAVALVAREEEVAAAPDPRLARVARITALEGRQVHVLARHAAGAQPV